MRKTRREVLLNSAAAAGALAMPGIVRAQEPIVLTTYNWGTPEEAKAYAAAFSRFSAANPGVSVADNFTPVPSWSDYADKLVTQVAGGNPPDIINIAIEAVALVVDKGLLIPLDDLIAASSKAQELVGRIPQSLKDSLSVDGKLYEIPNGWNAMVIYYNKRNFDNAGLPYPKAGWTWDDFIETAKALTDDRGGGKIYGFGIPWYNFGIHPWYLTNDTYPVTKDYAASNLSDPRMTECAQWIYDLVNVHGVSPDPIGLSIFDQFASGQIGMTGAGRWVVPGWVAKGFTDFDIAPWPSKLSESTVFGCAGWGISSESRHPELAFEAILELVSLQTVTEITNIGTQIPIYEEAARSESFLAAPESAWVYFEAARTAKPVASPKYFNALEGILIRMMDEVVSGTTSPPDALAAADRELKRAIRRAG